jgi:LAO/AO transport system kinase
LAPAIMAGDRSALAQGITLVESAKASDRSAAETLVDWLLPRAAGAVRVGITGPPGAGKSSLIEALGCRLTAAGRRVAVLAIDPSSPISGGAVLGDKTRMVQLASCPLAYVRPSSARGELGGVAARTAETILLVEAWGAQVVFVETVGVGQSEVAVANLVDCCVLLCLTGGGDELQGIKRGILEVADVLAVTKADGHNRAQACALATRLARNVDLLGPTGAWHTTALAVSVHAAEGLDALWSAIETCHATRAQAGELEQRRCEQRRARLAALITEGLQRYWARHPQVVAARARLEQRVVAGEIGPLAAADELLRLAGLSDDLLAG